MNDRAALHRLFEEEAREYLVRARRILDGDGALPGEGLAELKRIAHSVKGMASTVGEEQIAQAMHEAEELLGETLETEIDEGRTESLSRSFGRALSRLMSAAPPAADPDPRGAELSSEKPRVAIDAGKLDELLELSLALVASHQRLEHELGPITGSPNLFESRALLEKTVGSLREEIVELRWTGVRDLVPILEETLVRAAERRGVLVSFVVTGRATRIDRAVFQGLIEPLRQLVRNAVVHGIEPPEARTRQGKGARGTVRVAFERTGSSLRVTVEDDGRGVDRKILGLEEGEPILEETLIGRLTAPGVSRRRVADHDAGRGIGLAAVHSTLAHLGGHLELASSPGKGFRADLTVPLRIASADVFVARTKGGIVALPVDAVSRVGAAEGEEIPLWRPLGLTPREGESRDSMRLELAGISSPFAVEKLEGPQELIVRPLEAPIGAESLPWSGVTLLASGGLALLVDPVRLRRAMRGARDRIAPAKLLR